MKKIAILVFFLLTISAVSALDCQYTAKKEIKIPNLESYENGTKPEYPLLTIDSLIRHNKPKSKVNTELHSFKVNNNYENRIDLTVTFINAGKADSEDLTIDSGGYKVVTRPATEPTSIDENSITFIIQTEGYEKIPYSSIFEDVCAECPPKSGFICLRDGNKSDSDEKCGSGKRTAAGICSPKGGIIGDNICSSELGENCKKSANDCPCANNYKCSQLTLLENNGCEPDCANPPSDKACCPVNDKNEFRSKKAVGPNLPCNCIFECTEHYTCIKNTCQPDRNDTPNNTVYCPKSNSFELTKSVELGNPCNCDPECKEGVCFDEKCQKLINPQIKCPSGTIVEKGKTIQCNIYGSNTILNQDLKTTFILEADSGLSFSSSMGCSKIVGSQCIGNYLVADLSNEGITVELTANAGGNSNLEGKVTFDYLEKKIEEKVQPIQIQIGYCGDNIVDSWETKSNCCTDVSVENYSFLNLRNEKCEDNQVIYVYNWALMLILLIIISIVARQIVNSLTMLSEAKQREIAKKIEELDAQVKKKERELKLDESLMNKLRQEKATQEEINLIKERQQKTIHEINELREKEKQEKGKLKEDRQVPYTNKQNYKVIINDEGYEQFVKNLKYPDKPGLLFHRWYAMKEIYYKNRHKYPLPWHEYEVHHKDSNRRNNDLSNLEILSKTEHRRRHNF